MKVIIGNPYLEKNKEHVRVCSKIVFHDKEIIVWYEVEEKFRQYLCTERIDAFMIGLLPYIMAHSSDENPIQIKSESYLSEQLYYQLNSHYIPTVISETDRYFNVKIDCPVSNKKLTNYGAVGSGISGGVDSCYTLIKNIERDPEHYRISHGAYFDYDPNGNFYGEIQNALRERSKKLCDELGLAFVNVKSNICCDVYKMAHESIIASMLFSYVLILQKLFGQFHVSSTHPYALFNIVGYSQERFQLLNVHCFSNENLRFYTPGSEVKRYEKTHCIAQYSDEWPKKYMMVCMAPKIKDGNLVSCSKCAKCTKTMIDLDIIGKLDDFIDIFDVEYYRNNRDYYWGYLIFKGKKDPFIEETFSMFNKFNIKIPLSTYFSGFKKWKNNGFKRGNPKQFTYRP